MLRFELRQLYVFTPIFKPRIMSPLNRGSCLFVRFPGVPPLTRLHRRATIYRPSTGALISAGIRLRGILNKLVVVWGAPASVSEPNF